MRVLSASSLICLAALLALLSIAGQEVVAQYPDDEYCHWKCDLIGCLFFDYCEYECYEVCVRRAAMSSPVATLRQPTKGLSSPSFSLFSALRNPQTSNYNQALATGSKSSGVGSFKQARFYANLANQEPRMEEVVRKTGKVARIKITTPTLKSSNRSGLNETTKQPHLKDFLLFERSQLA